MGLTASNLRVFLYFFFFAMDYITDDIKKLEFAVEAIESTADPFAVAPEVHADIVAALQWAASKSAQEVKCEREMITREIERAAARHW